MGEQVIVSGGDALKVYAGLCAKPCGQIELEGAGALCAGREALYAACDPGNVIWRLDRQTLAPCGLFAGGPDMCRLLLSRDGERLFVLCRDADSLLMLDARTGAPLMLNRVGVAPCAMELDEKGEILAVAGGACGDAVLLDARTLCVLARLETCGVVFSIAIHGRTVYALSLNDAMNAVLTTFDAAGTVRELTLPGMPGALLIRNSGVAAAVYGQLYIVSYDGTAVLARDSAPGRACRLIEAESGLLLRDMWSDALFVKEHRYTRWRVLDRDARDMVCLL